MAYPSRLKSLKIGDKFTTPYGYDETKFWKVTDIGSRVIVAIEIGTPSMTHDPSWGNGPPYAVSEIVFDEDDYDIITLL